MNNKVTWVLLASLLVNAALLGFLVGNHGRGPMDVFRRMPPPGMGPQRPDDATRNVLRASFDAERENLRTAMKAVAEARRESETVLSTDPLDLDKLDTAMAHLRASSSTLQETFHRALRDAATKLNGSQRAALGRMLERAPTGRILNDRRGGGPGEMMGGQPLFHPGGPDTEENEQPLPPGMGLGAPPPRPPE